MRDLPTRDQVADVLAAHAGQGRAAMEMAVLAMKPNFADLTDELLEKIIADLESYAEYAKEL